MPRQHARRDSSMLDDSVVARFAARVQQVRHAAGLSLDLLAERSGVSRATLSNIERGGTNPSLGNAAKIAAALDLSVAQLLDDDPARRAVVVPAARRASFTDPDTGYQRQLYPAFDGGQIELVRHVVPRGVSSETLPPHPTGTEKYLVVESGRLRLHLDDVSHDAGPGDAVRFPADVPHRFENIGSGTATWLLIKPGATDRR